MEEAITLVELAGIQRCAHVVLSTRTLSPPHPRSFPRTGPAACDQPVLLMGKLKLERVVSGQGFRRGNRTSPAGKGPGPTCPLSLLPVGAGTWARGASETNCRGNGPTAAWEPLARTLSDRTPPGLAPRLGRSAWGNGSYRRGPQ